MQPLRIALVATKTKSTQQVQDILNLNHKTMVYDHSIAVDNLINDILHGVIDVIFPLTHNSAIEEGAIQGICSALNIPYIGSNIHATILSNHKATTKRIMMAHGTLTPEFDIIDKADDIDLRNIELPCVIKPGAIGMRSGITIPQTYNELRHALQRAFNNSDTLLVEKLIHGREFIVHVLGVNGDTAKVLSPTELIRTPDQQLVKKLYPTDLGEETIETLKNLGRRTFNAIGAYGILAIRFMYNENAKLFYFIEANTMPRISEHSILVSAAKKDNISFGKLLDELIQQAIQRNIVKE